MIRNLTGSADQYQDFIVDHEFRHLDNDEMGYTTDIIKEERQADLDSLRAIRLSGEFNNVNGFTDEIRYTRAMGVINLSEYTDGIVIPNPYQLSGSFDANGQVQDSQFDVARMQSSVRRVLNTAFVVEGMSQTGEVPADGFNMRYYIGKADYSKEPLDSQSKQYAAAGFNSLRGFDVAAGTQDLSAGMTRTYETLTVLQEAGAFSGTPEANAVVQDYLDGMRRYTDVESRADLPAARQRLAAYTTPEMVTAMRDYVSLPDTLRDPSLTTTADSSAAAPSVPPAAPPVLAAAPGA
jgi:hypothetical protein